MHRSKHITRFRKQLLPSPKSFYEAELGRMLPASRGWARANCPFHGSKSRRSFSVNLATGGFFCHGCGAKGGDVLAFFCLRYGLSFEAGARRLGAWDEAPKPETILRLEAQARAHTRALKAAEERRRQERQQRMALRNVIHTTWHRHQEAAERLNALQNGAPSATVEEVESCWEILSTSWDVLREAEREYMAVSGLEFSE